MSWSADDEIEWRDLIRVTHGGNPNFSHRLRPLYEVADAIPVTRRRMLMRLLRDVRAGHPDSTPFVLAYISAANAEYETARRQIVEREMSPELTDAQRELVRKIEEIVTGARTKGRQPPSARVIADRVGIDRGTVSRWDQQGFFDSFDWHPSRKQRQNPAI